jgi:hypothetical protein
MKYNLLSIDIGEKNLALLKEELNTDQLTSVTPCKDKFNQDNEPTQDFLNYTNKACLCFRHVWSTKVDLTDKTDKKYGKKRIINQKFIARLISFLQQCDSDEIFNNVDCVIIEKQLKTAENNKQIEIAIRTYFISLFSTWRPVISFASTHKTKVFGAPRKLWNDKKNKFLKMTQTQRKKWSNDKARNWLDIRKEKSVINTWYGKKKRSHDLADCLLMNFAFSILYFVEGKTELLEY